MAVLAPELGFSVLHPGTPYPWFQHERASFLGRQSIRTWQILLATNQSSYVTWLRTSRLHRKAIIQWSEYFSWSSCKLGQNTNVAEMRLPYRRHLNTEAVVGGSQDCKVLWIMILFVQGDSIGVDCRSSTSLTSLRFLLDNRPTVWFNLLN
jgi:hypothetical protein